MQPSIENLLNHYIFRKRIVAVLRSSLWASAIVVLLFHRPFMFVGIAIALLIIFRPIIHLFRRFDRVAAAVEIEKRFPEFDQRLITVASKQPPAPMLDHLRAEVQAILSTRPRKTHVSLRSLVAPVIVLLIAFWLHGFVR